MRRFGVHLNALRAFEAAARLSSFSAAASELHVSHSTISHHVKGLEKSLGRELFLRQNRRVILTSEAEALQRVLGNRYICAGEHIWMRDMAKMLDSEFRPRGYRVPTGHLPYAALWLASRFDKTLRSTLEYIGRKEAISCAKAKSELGWKPRPYRETLVDMGNSAIELGLVRAV